MIKFINIFKLFVIALIFVTASFSVSSAKSKVPESKLDITLTFAPLVKRIAPAVVNVYASQKIVQRSPFAGDPFFERFFGRDGLNRPRRRNKNSLGSGVIVDKSGIVITNHHVIKNADKIKVVLADGKEYDADIILKDGKADLAVLQIRSKDEFPIIPIGDSEDLEVGDLILAVGNPFGVGQTVTSGIISALARSQIGVSDFGFFIQTDAAINLGNSGGALVDMRGQLIGINTAIFSKSGGSHGIGFAIPSNMVKVVLRSTESGGDHVTRPWIGATFQTVTSDIAENLGLKRPRGAMVVGMVKGGPAEDSGLKVGDVILAINEQNVDHPDALGYRIATIGIGNDAKVTVLSRRKRKILDISLKAAPETIPRRKYEIGGRSLFSGATVYNLSPATAEELGMDRNKTGVVVASVKSRSFAHQYRLRKLDIIRNINEQEVTGTRQLKKFLGQRQQIWEFVIERKGRLLRRIVR
jgi:Do/DeqQ family serine protease